MIEFNMFLSFHAVILLAECKIRLPDFLSSYGTGQALKLKLQKYFHFAIMDF